MTQLTIQVFGSGNLGEQISSGLIRLIGFDDNCILNFQFHFVTIGLWAAFKYFSSVVYM